MVKTLNILTQLLYPESSQWLVGAWVAMTGAETVARLTESSLTDIAAVNNRLIIDGLSVQTTIAAGAEVYPTLRGSGYYVYLNSYTSTAATATARCYTPLNAPMTLAYPAICEITSTYAAADLVFVTVWGRWQEKDVVQPPYIGPQAVVLDGIKSLRRVN